MTTKTETNTEEYLLTVNDRCDVCGGQAYVAVMGTSGELMFCAHHYNKIMDDPSGKQAMQSFAYETIDERNRLKIKSNIYI
jgi:hypothetical protein